MIQVTRQRGLSQSGKAPVPWPSQVVKDPYTIIIFSMLPVPLIYHYLTMIYHDNWRNCFGTTKYHTVMVITCNDVVIILYHRFMDMAWNDMVICGYWSKVYGDYCMEGVSIQNCFPCHMSENSMASPQSFWPFTDFGSMLLRSAEKVSAEPHKCAHTHKEGPPQLVNLACN